MEADLLDEHRYEEWRDLFTEDARYHAPMKRNVSSREMDTELTREKIDVAFTRYHEFASERGIRESRL